MADEGCDDAMSDGLKLYSVSATGTTVQSYYCSILLVMISI